MDRRYAFAVLLAGMCWGSTGTLQALAPEGAHPLTVGTARIVVAGGVLLALNLLRRGKEFCHGIWPLRALFLAAVCLMGFQFAFFSALRFTGIAVGTMVATGSSPIMAGLLGWGLCGERPSPSWYPSTCLAIVGCICLSLHTSPAPASTNGLGILLAFGASLCYALVGILLKKTGNIRPSGDIVTCMMCMGALLGIPVFFTHDASWIPTSRGILVVCTLGVVSTALAYWLFSLAIKHVEIGKTYTLSLSEPLTACILSFFVLKERMDIFSSAGIIFIFLSVLLLIRDNKN